MKKLFLLIVIAFSAVTTFAQDYPNKGYRWFLDFDAPIYSNKDYFSHRYGIGTTHGYQFNRFFYLGGGVAYQYATTKYEYELPIVGTKDSRINENLGTAYVNLRCDFLAKKYSPFVEVKVGAQFDLDSKDTSLNDSNSSYWMRSAVGARLGYWNVYVSHEFNANDKVTGDGYWGIGVAYEFGNGAR